MFYSTGPKSEILVEHLYRDDESEKWPSLLHVGVNFTKKSFITPVTQVLSVCDKVSKHFFGGEAKPRKEDILEGYKTLVSDVIFNAIGTITARNIAKQATIIQINQLHSP